MAAISSDGQYFLQHCMFLLPMGESVAFSQAYSIAQLIILALYVRSVEREKERLQSLRLPNFGGK